MVSPQTGTVVGMQVHTIGGVIGAGAPILDIVPSNDELVIEAKINPLDIDVVHTGLTAKVMLNAFKRRSTPILEGQVTHVSADSFTEPSTGVSYYTAIVKITPEQIQRLDGAELYPGMPAQVMIVTNKRTPIEYFFSPILDSFSRAFRED